MPYAVFDFGGGTTDFSIVRIAAPGAHWANTAGDVHGTAMWVLLWLIGALCEPRPAARARPA